VKKKLKTTMSNRIEKEKITVKTMIAIYCKAHHTNRDILCSECNEMLEYAEYRLNQCPFADKKPTCAKCLLHCYKPQMRDKIKNIMRYSGPRMFIKHPLLAIHHIIHSICSKDR
jgi:uncharacterized CHY-type Zn-finger protein